MSHHRVVDPDAYFIQGERQTAPASVVSPAVSLEGDWALVDAKAAFKLSGGVSDSDRSPQRASAADPQPKGFRTRIINHKELSAATPQPKESEYFPQRRKGAKVKKNITELGVPGVLARDISESEGISSRRTYVSHRNYHG